MTAGACQASSLDRYFETAECAFSRAATSAGGSLDRLVQVAGHGARLRFAGPAMVGVVMPAIEHLEATDACPSLTILIWDAHSTGVTLPPPDWARLSYFERGNLRGVQDERFTLTMDRGTHVFSAVDRERRLAVYWARGADWVPYLERVAPLRHVLQGWLEPESLFVAHASAVGYPSGGVLMPGRAGSGKSTTAVLCLRAALGYLGDDFVLVSATGSPAAYSLYCTAKLTASTLAWMPEVLAEVSNPDRLDSEKALLFLRPGRPGRPGTLASGFPLRAILLPHVTGHVDTRRTPVSPMVALRRILPDTLFRSLGGSAVTARGLQRLVHELPCYDLALGQDLKQVTAAISDLLADA